MRILRVIYVLAIAALLIALITPGMEAFYPAPVYPDCYEMQGPAPDYKGHGHQEWG